MHVKYQAKVAKWAARQQAAPGAAPKRRPGRPPKVASNADTITAVIAASQDGGRERDRYDHANRDEFGRPASCEPVVGFSKLPIPPFARRSEGGDLLPASEDN